MFYFKQVSLARQVIGQNLVATVFYKCELSEMARS